jgi:hypothetical protein
MTRDWRSQGLLLMLVLTAFPSKCAALGDDDILFFTDPSPPRANEKFNLAAMRSFPDAGYEGIAQSVSINGNRIDIAAIVQDHHARPSIVFAQSVTFAGAWFGDLGPLAAGTYQANVKIWLTPWPATSGGQLINEENLQFSVAGAVPEPDALLPLICAFGGAISLRRSSFTCRERSSDGV